MNTLEKLDEYLSNGNNMNDYFYDCESVYIGELIDKLSLNEFEDLKGILDYRNDLWKRKLAYCLGNENIINELIILIYLINTKDEELYWICNEAIRYYENNGDSRRIILNSDKVLSVILEVIEKSDNKIRSRLYEFIYRIEYLENIIKE